MAITPQFLDELRSRVPVSDVVGKRVKLAKKGREFSGLCPFHNEKTPSFTVNDDKAFYHCLAAETGVIVKDGIVPIASLAGTTKEVLTRGGVWVEAAFKAYGIQRLYRIDLTRNGVHKSIFATSGHRWFVRGRKSACLTDGLRPGHRLEAALPVTRSDWPIDPNGVRHGIVFGDGTIGKRRYGHVHLHGEKIASLTPWFQGQRLQEKFAEDGTPFVRIYGGSAFAHMKTLPSFEEDDGYLLGFIAGYLATDGHVAKDGTVMLHSSARENLEWVRAAATRLGILIYGITGTVRRGYGKVDSEIFRLHFVPASLTPAMILRVDARERFVSARKAFARMRWVVRGVEETDRIEEVYCAEVPDHYAFALEDHILTGNCFGCGAHGDVIRFVTETEGLTFPEAVAKLAGMAGMEVPKATPEERQRAERAKSLQEACDAAFRFFRRRLEGPDGAAALAYLQRRGLKPETIEAFGLGWAPDGRSALKQALTGEGFPEAMLIEAGLLIKPEDGGESYDRFRGRVIFPIADRRGRVIAFGGRALGDIQPKYLNSPETPLFNKGRLLYALDKARQAVRDGPDSKGADVIVTEGYTDVIALHQAGFAGAVAPLGTALTESQIEELWRLAPEPVLCFDGDEAGRRAAGRALDRLLPRLVPGKTARFVFLPEGEDPDSFVSLSGPEAFGRLVDRATSVSEALWRRVAGTQTIDSPEYALIVRKNIDETVAQMAERDTQFYYRAFLNKRLSSLIWERRNRTNKSGLVEMKSDIVPEENIANTQKALVAALINHPHLIRRYGERLVEAEFVSPELAIVLMDTIELYGDSEGVDAEDLKEHLRARGHGDLVGRICSRKIYEVAHFADPAFDRASVEPGFADALRQLERSFARAELQQRLKRGLYREDDAEYARLSELAADIARQAAAAEEAEPG